MVSITSFVRNCVDRIVNAIPGVRCRYEHHAGSHTHFIEVIPNTVYKFDDCYIALEEKIMQEFDQSFLGEHLCFITSDSHYHITNPIYVNRGHSFVPKIVYKGIPVLSNSSFAELAKYFTPGNEAIDHPDVVMFNTGRGCKVNIQNSPPDELHEVEIKNVIETLYRVSLFFSNIAA